MLAMKTKQYIEVVLDAAAAFVWYYFWGWIGFALWVFFVVSLFCVQMIQAQKTTMTTLLSRLPNRCAMCHREIVDEGGVFDGDGIYHMDCSEKRDTPRER